MRERLKAIRDAAAPLADPAQGGAAKPLPGLVAALRAVRTPTAPDSGSGPEGTPEPQRPGGLAVVSITRHGIALAGKVVAALPGAQLFAPEKFRAEAEAAAPGGAHCYTGKVGDQIPVLFTRFDALVAIVSLGAVVRLIAPHLKSKEIDPAVVVLDEAGRFAIPVLSGHLGGANALAGHLGIALGAAPVLTTASDSRQTIGVDLLGHEFGWVLDATHAELVHCSAAMVNDEPVVLVQECGRTDWWESHANGRSGPLPTNVSLCQRIEDIDPDSYAAVLWISRRDMPEAYASRLSGKCVTYRPPEGA